MDVAAEAVFLTEQVGDLRQLLHGGIRAADDAGAQEQPLDAIAPIEGERQSDHLLDPEAGAADVAGAAVDTVEAVVSAGIGQQDL